MEVLFFTSSGSGLFIRSDMEEGHWIQEEMTVTATFPFLKDKQIELGQRLAFHDPATGDLVCFEIRNVTNIEPDHYQQITAESIAIAELSDDHINTTEITEKTAKQALDEVLSGSLWSSGTVATGATNESSGDISRGSVWQAVKAIEQNWNVYIVPRITLSGSGSIATRKLDIYPAQGVFRGIRLSIDKNMSDSTVTYDDSEVYTALYGYGGNVDVPQSGDQDDKQEELTFAEVVWSQTSSHPAKPADQTYLEWPGKTALYGRGNPPRPRFGYYQNGSIDDAEILLQKTWETLQTCSDPKISISGTATDLYRLGYHDEPMRLHDIVEVDIRQTGEKFRKEIIRLDVDLLNPSGNRPEIGDYVPNIIYINRETDEAASGGGGGGGGHGPEKLEYDEQLYYTEFIRLNDQIGMIIGRRNGTDYVKGGEIILAINADGGTTAHIQADVIDMESLELAINASHITIDADRIDINGIVTQLQAIDLVVNALTITGGDLDCGAVDCGQVDCTGVNTNDGDIITGGLSTDDLTVGANAASWQSKVITTYTLSNTFNFVDGSSNLHSGKIITDTSTETIYYLGRTVSA